MGTKKTGSDDVRAAVDRALDLLKEDPPRLKRLLRESAGLADDVSAVLADADEQALARRVSLVAKTLRGGAMLPARMSVALLRKAVERFVR
jgi:hypothetical protein